MTKEILSPSSRDLLATETPSESSNSNKVVYTVIECNDIDDRTSSADSDAGSDSLSDLSAGLTGSPPRILEYLESYRLGTLNRKPKTRKKAKPVPWWDLRTRYFKGSYKKLNADGGGVSDTESICSVERVWVPTDWQARLNEPLPPLPPRKDDQYRNSYSSHEWRWLKRTVFGNRNSTPSDQGVTELDLPKPDAEKEGKVVIVGIVLTVAMVCLLMGLFFAIWRHENEAALVEVGLVNITVVATIGESTVTATVTATTTA
ncbi:hypothetical protein TWF730_007387 [Orbilia blumenaviensis]|uniref:Uncharacterized protein n=1 Tax=Orbilia blumenaviensis TaxID=1796055 RepID=A0AAV9V8S3_9PEZI